MSEPPNAKIYLLNFSIFSATLPLCDRSSTTHVPLFSPPPRITPSHTRPSPRLRVRHTPNSTFLYHFSVPTHMSRRDPIQNTELFTRAGGAAPTPRRPQHNRIPLSFLAPASAQLRLPSPPRPQASSISCVQPGAKYSAKRWGEKQVVTGG